VLRCDIDARSNKVVVTASTKLDPSILVAKLRRSGKQAELWPEQPPPAESQGQLETKNLNDEQSKPAAEKAGPDNAEASNPQQSPEPKQSNDGETPEPATESKEATNAGEEETVATEQQQHNEAKGKQPVDARVAVEYGRGGDSYMPAPQPIMSYNMARPSPSASYYAAHPAPMPMARPGPSQGGYVDEHYTPSYYYGRSSSPYEQQPYYHPPQPSPYSYNPYQPASSEDYYYSAPPHRSAFSPPRDGYGDMFNDENANSCAVM
jgi:hypothetical protein